MRRPVADRVEPHRHAVCVAEGRRRGRHRVVEPEDLPRHPGGPGPDRPPPTAARRRTVCEGKRHADRRRWQSPPGQDGRVVVEQPRRRPGRLHRCDHRPEAGGGHDHRPLRGQDGLRAAPDPGDWRAHSMSPEGAGAARRVIFRRSARQMGRESMDHGAGGRGRGDRRPCDGVCSRTGAGDGRGPAVHRMRGGVLSSCPGSRRSRGSVHARRVRSLGRMRVGG